MSSAAFAISPTAMSASLSSGASGSSTGTPLARRMARMKSASSPVRARGLVDRVARRPAEQHHRRQRGEPALVDRAAQLVDRDALAARAGRAARTRARRASSSSPSSRPSAAQSMRASADIGAHPTCEDARAEWQDTAPTDEPPPRAAARELLDGSERGLRAPRIPRRLARRDRVRGRRLQGADLRALREQARAARRARRAHAGEIFRRLQANAEAGARRGRSGCAAASTRSCRSSRRTATPGARCSATPPIPRSSRRSRAVRDQAAVRRRRR